MPHGDPKNPKKNPHPVQRYELTATADAPGEWDSVKGYISYEVINYKCTPEDKFLGVHALPKGAGEYIEMKRIGENTWRGYFFRDLMLDEDYYDLGDCHWDTTSISLNFVAHKSSFNSGSVFNTILKIGRKKEYFRKSDFEDISRTSSSLVFQSSDSDVIRHPEDFFSIMFSVNESMP